MCLRDRTVRRGDCNAPQYQLFRALLANLECGHPAMAETRAEWRGNVSEAPLELIEDLASKQAQVQWIINGTKDEYLLPEEMLNEGLRFCRIVLASQNPTTSRQRDTVRALMSAIDDSGLFLSNTIAQA